MDKYLLEILKNVNTIIIPGLGALTITNHDTGEIMFMPYLKHDDGKLTQYIVENEGFEELDAKNLIAKYVREIQLTLDKGESYDMFQFGSFFKDGDDIDFKNWKGSNKAETKVSSIEEPKEVTEKVTVEPPVDSIVEEVIPPIIEKKEKQIISPIVEEIKPTIPNEKVEPIVVHLEEEVEKPKKVLNILEKEERASTVAKLEKLKSDKDKPTQKNKKGVGFWMLITLLVLIVAGGTYFGMNYNELKQHVPFLADSSASSATKNLTSEDSKVDNSTSDNSETDEETFDDKEPELQDESIVDEQVSPTKVVEEKVKTPPASSGNDLPFHIIAGAFSSEDNANRLGDKLRNEGYTVKVGPGRGMTLVSIKSFKTRAEAQQGLNELQSVAPSGWIYEWN